MIALLLFQDLLAIIVLAMMESAGIGDLTWRALLQPLLTLPLLGLVSWLSVKTLLLTLIRRFDRSKRRIRVSSSVLTLSQLTSPSSGNVSSG